jgi:hypothetical protein
LDSPTISITVRPGKKETQDSEIFFGKLSAIHYGAWKAYAELEATERAWLREVSIVVHLMDDGLNISQADISFRLEVSHGGDTWKTGRAFTLNGLSGQTTAFVTGLVKSNIRRNIRYTVQEQAELLHQALERLEDKGISSRKA